MAKRTKKSKVFLIINDTDQRAKLATGLRSAGYDVHDYMTAREFLIDQKNHSGGVVIADYRLRGMTGRELAEQLNREGSDFPVVLTAGPADMPKVIGSDAADILVKPVAMDFLEEAIKRATDGELFTDAELERAFRKVTKREREVVALVVAGKSSMEIGEALDVATKTVEAHRLKIMDKTRADDVGHLVRMWRAWNQ